MISLMKNKPHQVLLSISLIIGSIGLAIWRFDKKSGYSSSNTGDFENFLRLTIGILITTIPFLLVFALVYWLMYKFNRPTRPTLNFWHLTTLFAYFLGSIAVGYFILNDNKPIYDFEDDWSTYLISAISIASLLIFIVNIVLSLVKPVIMEENNLENG